MNGSKTVVGLGIDSGKNSSKKVVRLGIDLGKNYFHLWGVNEEDERVLKKKVRRSGLLREVANLSPCRIEMEACGGAHHWARSSPSSDRRCG